MTPSRPTGGPITLPEVWEDEDGERCYAMGHVSAEAIVLAAAVNRLQCVPGEETFEWLERFLLGEDTTTTEDPPKRTGKDQIDHLNAVLNSVTFTWFIEDPECEELAIYVDASHPGAEPVTWVDLPW